MIREISPISKRPRYVLVFLFSFFIVLISCVTLRWLRGQRPNARFTLAKNNKFYFTYLFTYLTRQLLEVSKTKSNKTGLHLDISDLLKHEQ